MHASTLTSGRAGAAVQNGPLAAVGLFTTVCRTNPATLMFEG
jgi:hypothetical protein